MINTFRIASLICQVTYLKLNLLEKISNQATKTLLFQPYCTCRHYSMQMDLLKGILCCLSTSMYMYSATNNLTCEHGTSLKFGHLLLFTYTITWSVMTRKTWKAIRFLLQIGSHNYTYAYFAIIICACVTTRAHKYYISNQICLKYNILVYALYGHEIWVAL